MTHPGSRFLLVVSSLLLLLLGACGGEEDVRTTPPEIRGVWTATSGDGVRLKFEVLEDALLFHTDGGGFDLYVIREIRREEAPEGIEYEIDHRGRGGGTLTLAFTFRPEDSTLVYRNRPLMVWSRER